MLTLSIRRPWIDHILTGRKTIEVRTWTTHHSGPLALHASKAPGDRVLRDLVPGCVVAVATVVDCVKLTRYDAHSAMMDPDAIDGLFGWVLDDVRRVCPFPVRGNARFFKVDDSLIRYL